MTSGSVILATLRAALHGDLLPESIARVLRHSLAVFGEDPSRFDSAGLQGPVKHAELIVKLGYWLLAGRLRPQEFHVWSECIPAEDNAGWDVDLVPGGAPIPGRQVLKMGPLFTNPEACLVQNVRDSPGP